MNLDRVRELQIDLCGAAVAILVMAAGYGLYLNQPLSDAMRRRPVQDRFTEVSRQLDSLRANCTSLRKEADDARAGLTRLAASLRSPASTDELLSRLDHLAVECGLQIAAWQPGGDEIEDQYSTHVYWLQGRASFPDLCKWLSLMENGVPLLDVSHFSIREGNDREADGRCEFDCTLRLYTGWDAVVTEVAQAGP